MVVCVVIFNKTKVVFLLLELVSVMSVRCSIVVRVTSLMETKDVLTSKMADRRKGRKKKDQEVQEESKPSKVEYAIAKYLRDKLPVKKTTLLNHKVEYFIASKAVESLMDSKWATNTVDQTLFTTRESVVKFMDNMLRHKFFHRAKKIVVQKDNKKKKKDKEDESNTSEEMKEKEKEKEKETKPKEKEKKKKAEKEEKEKTDAKKDDADKKKKEKKKIKLDMHLEQVFVDGNEVYVWIYDPIPLRAWVIGTLLVVGAVLVCLFPLWPKIVRHYVYYLSVAATGFLIFIIVLAVVRLAVFVIIWLVSFGKHHLWLLPNLTEDVGFVESFWPLYKYEFKGQKEIDDDSNKDEKLIETKETQEEKEESSSDQDGKDSEDQAHSESERDSDEVEKDKDKVEKENGDNGFEILDPL